MIISRLFIGVLLLSSVVWVLGRFLVVLGGLRGSFGGLGRLLGRLGAVWVVLCENDALRLGEGAVWVLKRVPRWEPLGSLFRTKSESKTKTKKDKF